MPYSIEQILESPESFALEWGEPWPGIDKDGNPADAHQVLRVSVPDAIRAARAAYKSQWDARAEKDGKDPNMPWFSLVPDRELLLDFIAVHWCKIVKISS